jgi:hypothetical protein
VPEPSAFEFELAIEKFKSHRSPGIDQIPAELIKAGGRTIRCAIHKLIIAIWNEEELPEVWKESIIVPIYKKGDKTDCSNYRGISLLLIIYKILSNILLSRLIPYAEEIIGDHQCGFQHDRSTTDHIILSIPTNAHFIKAQNATVPVLHSSCMFRSPRTIFREHIFEPH